MPLHEYQCESCGRRSEVLQKMNDAPLTVCPDCGGALRKLFSAPSFQLKGSGWYASDYAKKPSGDSAKGAGSGGEEKGAKPAESAAPATKDSSAPAAGPTGSTGTGGSAGSAGSGGSETKSPSTSKAD